MKILRFLFIIFILSLILLSCDKRSKAEKEAENIEIKLDEIRFEQLYYQTRPEDFKAFRQTFPVFFPNMFPDSVFVNKLTNPLNRELYEEVQKTFPNIKKEKEDIVKVLQLIKYHFPKAKTPKKLVTIITEMDYENSVLYTDSLLIVSLDLFLGKEHRFYDGFNDYQRQNFEKHQITQNLIKDFATYVVSPPKNRTLLDQMILAGKELYLKDLLTPQAPDHEKIGYTKEKHDWCIENENQMWRYFIENNMLYNSSSDAYYAFIQDGPFSKFNLEIESESPGRVGTWLGWQIVRDYMKNNETPLQTMLDIEAKTLFERSKYKPKQ
jgi:gliding motility-associated lipoprotein GldB